MFLTSIFVQVKNHNLQSKEYKTFYQEDLTLKFSGMKLNNINYESVKFELIDAFILKVIID